MEESVLLHRLESRTPGHKVQAIEELIGLVRSSGKLHFNNKLSLFSSFKRILQDDDLMLRTKCTKLISDIIPKLGGDMDTCMSFVMPNILSNMAANNLILKRESIKLIKHFSEISRDTNGLVRCIIWEGIDNKDVIVSKEVILNLDKLILNIIKTEDCYNIVAALCKRFYLEDNKKLRKAIRDSFGLITHIIGHPKMEEIISQLPTSALSAGKELLQTYTQTERPKLSSYKSVSKLEYPYQVDSAISVEMKLWDLIPESTLAKLHGDDVAEQLKAIAELEEAIRGVTHPGEYLICIDEICDAIIKVIPINNFRVFKASTMLVSTFVDVFRDVMGDTLCPLTRVLCHKIGDNKIAVREGTMKCLTQLMKMCGPKPVLDIVLLNFRDRNPRVREEAINVVIKAMLTFPIQELNVNTLMEYLASMLGDSKPRVVNAGLEGIAVLSENLPPNKIGLIYRTIEKIDYQDRRYLNVVKNRLEKGTVSTLNDAGLVTHGEGCFSRNGSSMGTQSRISVPTTSQERAMSKDYTMTCPPTPLSLPRRYYSAGRNRLPWERPSRQNTLVQGAEEQFSRPNSDRNHVFIKGGGARTDGGSYAQMHLKKMQKDQDEQQVSGANSPRSNTLGSLKKYFPSVKGSPDPKKSWPAMKNKDDEVLSNGSSVPPAKSNSFSNDTGYGVQNSSMYESYRVNSGESSGVGTLTNNTPNGSATQQPPRHNQSSFSPSSTLNDSGIFEEHSFVNVRRATQKPREDSEQSPQAKEHSRLKARKEILLEEEMKREEERLELARRDKIRMEELAKEERRRELMRLEIQRQEQQRLQEIAEQERREEEVRKEYNHIGNGYVELTSQNLAKKKLKHAAEESRKPRPKLVKARTRTESISCDPADNVEIDVVGKGLSSGHIDYPKEPTKDHERKKSIQDKTPLRAPSGVYGQRVHPSRSPDETFLVDGSLSDDDDDESDSSDRRDGHPVGSGLSAATRMRFEKKRAQYVERQSAEQRPPRSLDPDERPCGGGGQYDLSGIPNGYPADYTPPEPRERPTPRVKPSPRVQHGKPVSAPIESRVAKNADTPVKRSPSKSSVRASSLKPGDLTGGEVPDSLSNNLLVDEKYNVPLSNPDHSLNEALKTIKIGGDEWSHKVDALHVLRRICIHHPDVFQKDLITVIRLTCAEVPNLRSTVSRLAIQVVGDYFVHLKTVMDTDIDRTTECLLAKTAEMNQFIRNDTIGTLGKVVEHGTSTRVLSALIQGGASHKNQNVRSVTATCFKDVIAKMGVNRVFTSKDLVPKFLTAVERFCRDGNQETRYWGRVVLSWCMDNPNLDTLCNKHLPATAARNIRDMCDKLQAKGVGSLPASSDRTSGRYRSQPMSRAQSNLSATYPGNRSRKQSQESLNVSQPSEHNVHPSPRVSRRSGPRRDLREAPDKMPASLYSNLNSSHWQDRYSGIAELLELCMKQPQDVRQCIVRISDAFTPRLKDPNSKVNLYALQCLLRMLPHLDSSLDLVLTPLIEHLVPNLASQRANIVTLTSQILDGFRVHVDNAQLMCEYCRIVRTQNNPRIKPIILDKISDMVKAVYETRPKLIEQITIPIVIENYEALSSVSSGGNNLGGYLGRVTKLLHGCMGNKLLSEISRIKPATLNTIREYLMSNT